jgi:hypothetical protein
VDAICSERVGLEELDGVGLDAHALLVGSTGERLRDSASYARKHAISSNSYSATVANV